MNLVRIKLGKFRSDGFGFNVQDRNGKIYVTQVFSNSVAFNSGLCCGDKIYSVNNEIVNESAIDFANTINQIKGKVQLLVYRTNSYGRSQHSYNNLSTTGSDPISNSGSQKLKTCRSSIDLLKDDFNLTITDGNYVPEDLIDSFIEPISIGDNFDDNTDPIQITRKQAYKKQTNDVACHVIPKYSVKKATTSTPIHNKDPSITLKRKTNNKMSDVVTTATNSNQRPRPAACKQIDVTQNTLPSLISNRLLSSTKDENISIVTSDVMTPPSSSFESIQLEIDVKIISFFKIRKPLWNKFMVEKDALGVLFHCLDMDEEPMSCNSTAIDPYISGLNFYMTMWQSNNTVSRFFLPIGQSPFNSEIEMTPSAESIHIVYNNFEVEFLIDLLKLTEDKIALLFSLLGLQQESPDPKPSQTKAKRNHGNSDTIKMDNRRHKTQRYAIDSSRISTISSLPQTKLIANVPLVVIICINIIEALGIKDTGIYRISGNETLKKKLENAVNNESPEKWVNYEEWTNVNTVCSLLKSVLRSFSLIDRDTAIKLSMINLGSADEASQNQVYMDMVYHLRRHFCRTDTRTDQGVKDRTIHEMRCRFDTFKYVIKHLDRVARYQEFNKMPADNLATCFWPTIIEDIPCPDDGDYQTSKKSDADKNLKQMVTFWISNADFLCELLEEENDEQRYKKLVLFSDSKKSPEINSDIIIHEKEVTDKDEESVVRQQMEFYTSQAFVPVSEPFSLGKPRSVNSQEIIKVMRMKSRKQLSVDHSLRRSSTSLSPRNMRKIDSMIKGFSPTTGKTIDNLTTKSERSKKKELVLQSKKEVSLSSLSLSGSVKNIPLIIEVCVAIINHYGLNVDGIYRISGRKQDLCVLEDMVLNDRYLLWHHEPYLSMWSNMYIVSGLLKSVLRPFCLIRKETWLKISKHLSDKMERDDVRKVLMSAAYHLRQQKSTTMNSGDRETIESEIRSATLRYVLRHLKTVSRHVNNTRMASTSLAVCFMPVLMEEEDSLSILTVNVKGIQIVEKLIDHCDWIFRWDDRPIEDMYSKAVSDSLDEYLRGYAAKEFRKRAPRTEDYGMSIHTIDCDDIRDLLERVVSKCNIAANNRLHCRRHSDGSDISVRKSVIDEC